MFHSFCDRGEAENALNIFDREQLLAFGTETTEASEEIWAEYPRIVAVSSTKKMADVSCDFDVYCIFICCLLVLLCHV